MIKRKQSNSLQTYNEVSPWLMFYCLLGCLFDTCSQNTHGWKRLMTDELIHEKKTSTFSCCSYVTLLVESRFIQMRKGNARPLTAGPVPKRYKTLPRIWRPKTSVYRKNIQDVGEMDNCDSEHSSDEEEYDSDSTVSQSDSGPRTRTGERHFSAESSSTERHFSAESSSTERHFSAESSSTQILSNIKSEEDLEYNGQILHDLKTQATSLDTTGCHFGEVPMQYATKRMEIKEPENCHCLANLVHYESNVFGPWKSTCKHRIHRQKTQTEQRNVNSKMSQVPNLYQRLNRNSSKNYIYPFCHFENRGKYIQQYRELYSSVGKFQKALDFPKENKISNPLPDPYLKRLRSNVWYVCRCSADFTRNL